MSRVSPPYPLVGLSWTAVAGIVLVVALAIPGDLMAQDTDSDAVRAAKEAAAIAQQQKLEAEARLAALQAQRAADALTNTTPAEEQAARLAELQAEKAIAEAKRALENVGAPTPQTTALQGSLTVDSTALIESQIAVFDRLPELTKRFVESIPTSVTGSILVLHDRDNAALLAAQVFATRAGMIQQTYSFIKEGAATDSANLSAGAALAGLGTATTAVRAVADFVALFRQDVQFQGRPVSVSTEAVVAAFANGLRGRSPALDVYAPESVAGSGFAKIADASDALVKMHLAPIETVRYEAIAEVEKLAPGKPNDADPAIAGQAEKKARYTRLLADAETAYQALFSFLNAVDEKTGLSGMAVVLRGLYLEKQMEARADASILRVRVEAAGGTYVLRKSLWFSRVDASGGIAISYTLTAAGDGKILASGTLQDYGVGLRLPVRPSHAKVK